MINLLTNEKTHTHALIDTSSLELSPNYYNSFQKKRERKKETETKKYIQKNIY